MEFKCHKCLVYSCVKTDEGFYCNECNILFSISNKKTNKSRSFNNKKIHFNNVMKDMSKKCNNMNEDIDDIIESVKENNIKDIFLNQSFISNLLKKGPTRFKDYKKVFNILNELDSNKKSVSQTMKDDIKILFISYIKFLSNKKKLDSISYNLVLGNIFSLFEINKNFKPMVKDEKEDLWNMFIYTITNNYFNDTLDDINDSYRYLNYKPKQLIQPLYKEQHYIIS